MDVNGGQIVFDLLGDIYTMPVTGGKPTALISGVPWTTQPHFSPDGKYLVYTSDESGCDNIWIYSFDLGRSMQVTYEPYFYVSNAKFKNSTHIVANKWHLVLDRGIAGGEIWEFALPTDWSNPLPWGDRWHKNEGVMLAGRTNAYAQFGPEEPFFDMSSGRYLYYSRNMVDTRSWTYNKDPHAGIYSILRVDTLNPSADPVVITGGPGGAARPVLSPDGATLAFVRRTVFQTSLMLRNMTSGNEIQLFNLGYQDQQESWAPCGVFPSFSFLAGSDGFASTIIVWGAGNIWAVPLPTSIDSPVTAPVAATIIPFDVEITRNVAPVVRSAHNPKQGWDATSNTFITHVALHASISPSNTNITFSSLGQIYIASLNADRSITAPESFGVYNPYNQDPNDTLFYWPSVNWASKMLARTGWNDGQYGWVEIVDLRHLTGRTITTLPGRYVKPMFNQQGNRIIYGKAGGDSATGDRNSHMPGIYLTDLEDNGLPISGKADQFVCAGEWMDWDYSTGTDPSKAFGLVVTASSFPYTVDRISLAPATIGQLDRHFAYGQYVQSMAFSYDMSLVAFTEFEVVYVQRVPKDLTPSQYPMQITARLDNIAGSPNTQILAKTGGDFLSFSQDGILSFGWANNFTSVNLSSMASPSWKCSTQYCFSGTTFAKSISLGQNVTAGTSVETLVVFDNATVIPMDSRYTDQVLLNQRIVVQGDVIKAMGSPDTVPVPEGATRMDLAGGYVLPGFIDAHAHWPSAFTQRWGKSKQGWEFLTNLAFGVTTLHNPSAEFWSVYSDQELIRSGKKIGPRIFSTGSVMFGAGGDLHCEIPDVQTAEEALGRRAAFGGFTAKSYMIMCRAGRQKLLQAARNLNFEVVPEGGMHYAWDLTFIVDGHTTVEHSLPMAPFYKDVLQLFASAQTAWTPTMVVSFGGIFGDHFFYQNSSVFLDPTVQHWIPDNEIQPVSMRRIEADKEDYHVFTIAETANNVSQTGTLVNIGAHGQMQGIGYFWELKFMQSGGMSNYDVLKTATINPAKTLGLDAHLGSIYPGKLADLVFLEPGADPLAELEALRQIKYVMLDGNLYDTATFARILPMARPAPVLTVINTPVV